MKINPVICKQCGGSISLDHIPILITCPYCGTSYITDYSDTSFDRTPSINRDNPISILIKSVDQPIINCWYYSFSQLESLIYAMSTIAYFREEDLICRFVGGYSNELRNTDKRVLKERLERYGCDITTFFRVTNDEWVAPYIGILKVSPKLRETYCDLELDKYVKRMVDNNTILELAETINSNLSRYENRCITELHNGPSATYIDIRSSVLFHPGPNRINYACKHEGLRFHEIGYENLSSFEQMMAFSIALIINVSWNLYDYNPMKSIDLENARILMQMLPSQKYEQKFNKW